jgi:hypothetical protein
MNGGGASASEMLAASAGFGGAMDGFSVSAGGAGGSNMTDHESGDDAAQHALLPLTLPTSPTLLPLSASPVSSAMEMAAKHHAAAQHAVQQAYFAAEVSVHGSGGSGSGAHPNDFAADLQKASDDYRRLAEASTPSVSLELAAMPTSSSSAASTAATASLMSGGAPVLSKRNPPKKRKAGANVSIDLQTKIRLIELAEEYQYDPKIAGRSKQGETSTGSALSASAKDQMSGIRLAAQFGLNKSTVSRILKRKEEFKKAYYKDNISGCSKHINKKSKFEKLNRLVENWFDMNRDKKIAVTDTHIRDVGKRFAEELGINDFRGSNGWVRSLRNRKEHQSRNMSVEAMELEKMKKDAEAIERMRAVFPNGMKDLSGFFRDLSTFLEKGVGHDMGFPDAVSASIYGGASSDRDSTAAAVAAAEAAMNGGMLPASAYGTFDPDSDSSREEDRVSDEFLKKKMIDSMRTWSHELMEAELSRMKKRLKPRSHQLTSHHQHHEQQDLEEEHSQALHQQQAATL